MQTTTSENHDSLIDSSRVEGTAVYNLEGEQIGSIEHLMLEKRGGRVAHAVMSFGGFLGIGEEHYPIPWSKLTYDTELGGYPLKAGDMITITRDINPQNALFKLLFLIKLFTSI